MNFNMQQDQQPNKLQGIQIEFLGDLQTLFTKSLIDSEDVTQHNN